jgi:hypothetical protein
VGFQLRPEVRPELLFKIVSEELDDGMTTATHRWLDAPSCPSLSLVSFVP